MLVTDTLANERIILDKLRVLAVCLVIVGHATRMFTTHGVYFDVIKENILLSAISNVIYSFHMPLFFLVSGYVYGICVRKGGSYNLLFAFMIKKAKRLLIPYLFFGLAYVAPVMVFLSITTMSYKQFVVAGLLFGLDCRHLWFLLVLFEIFMVVHIFFLLFRKIHFNPIIISAAALLVSFGIRFLPDFPNYVQFSSFCKYSLFFLCGFILKRAKENCNWGGALFVFTNNSIISDFSRRIGNYMFDSGFLVLCIRSFRRNAGL